MHELPSKMFIFEVMKRDNPALTPRVCCRSVLEAVDKLQQVQNIVKYIRKRFIVMPDGSLRKWAGKFLLDERDQMELPPLWPRDAYLDGTLERKADDKGGYGGYLLKTLADIVVTWPRHVDQLSDKEFVESAKPVLCFDAAFPILVKTLLSDDEIDEIAVMGIKRVGELIIERNIKNGD